MFHIHTSNQLEYLIQTLTDIIKIPLPNPLTKEIIVVQSKGMERWISMMLAQYLGVWANGDFPFPEVMLQRIFREIIGYSPTTPLFKREVMVWSLIEILPRLIIRPQFSEIRTYLRNDKTGIKLFQLAWRIAEVFDQYVIYRPQWVLAWEKDEQPPELQDNAKAAWQAILWRELAQREGGQHRARLRQQFLKNLPHHQAKIAERFQRISIFGISALPLFYLEAFAEIGKLTEIHVFLINPCQEYWGDIVTDGEIARRAVKAQEKLVAPETLYFTKGNSLLASMGKLGRDFIDLLTQFPHDIRENFVAVPATSLLHSIQADIFQLQERGETIEKTVIQPADQSIQIHACHSYMREIEVLHDQLLALFAAHPDLLPKDIVVMVPDIETYAPFIQAVFATTVDAAKRIPFSIADRSLRGESVLIDTFLAILELNQGRFGVNEILSLLEVTAIQQRFALEEPDLKWIRHWIRNTGIRWGLDGSSRAQMELPQDEEHTWRSGLNRLLLGYALPGGGERLFCDILPFDDLEGEETLILGKLIAFVENLFNIGQELEKPRPLSQWVEFLTTLVGRFLSADESSESQLQQIRRVLNELGEYSQQAQFHQPVSNEVVQSYLRLFLEGEPLPTHFLTGNVTFCTLLPMRSIPFKVVCLLGMNDRDYPRSHRPVSFDLIAQLPMKAGDRSRRQNDRYLFLEALLSARENLYISYVGQSIHDNSTFPPSVLVSELQDYVVRGFTLPQTDSASQTVPSPFTGGNEEILQRLVTRHPLQAFSHRYFDDSSHNHSFFSYSTDYCAASMALLGERQTVKPFMTISLPPPRDDSWKIVHVNELVEFFSHPARFLLKKRLGIYLSAGEALLEETEPFEISGLEAYSLKQQLAEQGLNGQSLTDYYTIAKAAGLLPHGSLGHYAYRTLADKVYPFVEQVKQESQKPLLATQSIDLTIGDKRIHGYLNNVWEDKLLHYRCAPLKAKDHIRLWIYHVLLNHLATREPSNSLLPRHSTLIGEDETWHYREVEKSQPLLETFLDLYWRGLSEPLHFFPNSSLIYMEKWLEKGEEEALKSARIQWQGSDFARGESQDEYFQLCFGKNAELPLTTEFKILAQTFFEPLLRCRRAQ